MLGHFPCVWLRCWSQPGWVEPVFWLFGWRLGAGWVGSRRIFLSDAGWTRPSKSGGRSRSSRVGSHQTLNSFNQTLNGAALSPILQPNTKMGWLRPQNQKCNQTLDGLAPSPKTGLDPTQPTQPPTKHTVMHCFQKYIWVRNLAMKLPLRMALCAPVATLAGVFLHLLDF